MLFTDWLLQQPSPSVKVGQVAGSTIEHTFPGDVFPQFTHHGKSDYHCKLCIPFQRWAKTNSVKQVTIDDIINDTAILNFSGAVRAHEHVYSRAHREPNDFFKRDLIEKVCNSHEGKPARKEATIADYFGPKKHLN